MTCVMACKTDDNKVVIVTDSAIGDGDGFRMLMSQPKIWDMGCLVIGEAGDDFALSRIRQKTQTLENWEELRDPYTFSDLICQIQKDISGGLSGVEALEAELLHVGTNKKGECALHVVGGEGGVVGPFPYMAVGEGRRVALPMMDALIAKRMKKITVIKATNIMMEIMEYVDSYVESVKGPFHPHIYDPNEKFKEL